MSPLRRLLIPTVAAVLGLTILLKLGFWQLDRLASKENLIRQVEEGINRAPVASPGPDAWELLGEEDDYRHVSVKGAFLSGAVYYYIALSDPAGQIGGPGVMVYSPFRTEAGWVILLNRGFLPDGLSGELETEALEVPPGQLELTGILRLSETPKWTTPAPSGGLWFARDTGGMAQYLNVSAKDLAPYSIDLDAAFTPANGLPQAGETIVRFKNDHLGYALTWFGLAATLLGVYLAYAASLLWPRKDNI